MNRPFQFFDREPVDSAVVQQLEITCCAAGKGKMAFGDHQGMVRIMDASWGVETRFPAYESAVTHLKQINRNVLVSVGNDSRHEATIKFWDLGKRDRNGRPAMIKALEPVLKAEGKPAPQAVPLRLSYNAHLPIIFRGNVDDEGGYQPGTRQEVDGASLLSPVICFDVSEDLDICVLGLTNGDICMYRGDLLFGRFLKPTLLSKDHALGGAHFLGLKKVQGHGQGTSLLYAVYEKCTSVWRIEPRMVHYEQLADFGAPPECSCLCEDTVAGDLAVARDDGIIFFAEDIGGQGACWAFEGVKKKVYSYRSSLIILTEEAESAVAGGLRRGPERKGSGAGGLFNVTIYDLKNKFKVFSSNQRNAQQVCLCEW